jgi:3' terminal RNA ribose 2'-O-methyltransferase Hen1
MLITLSMPATPQTSATDLGYLLHKHPGKVQRFKQSFGQAIVFYPQADEACCTAALLVDIDPVQLVRGKSGQGEGLLAQYVNDRPYAASSLLAVALGDVFRSALGGRCPERPELAASNLPLRVEIPALPCRGGEAMLRKLFEPLDYAVHAQRLPYDEAFPAWGDSPYFGVRLEVLSPLSRVLAQLSVLLPVLDDDKHYWIGDAEVDKLLQRGGDWLAAHPHKDIIARRYLKHRAALTCQALKRLQEHDFSSDEDDDAQDAGDEQATSQTAKEAAEAALKNPCRWISGASRLCWKKSARWAPPRWSMWAAAKASCWPSWRARNRWEKSWAWMYPAARWRLPSGGLIACRRCKKSASPCCRAR